MKDRNAEVDFHGQKRSNATHASTTDPDARLYRKGQGKEAKLCHMGHALMENRSGLIVETETTLADGHAERRAALAMINRRCPGEKRITLGADKGYDAADFVTDLRAINVTPHVAAKLKGVGPRRPHHPARGLHREPAHPQADRRSLRLGQDRRHRRQDHAARHHPRWFPVYPQHGRL